jgi:hypothetical protein
MTPERRLSKKKTTHQTISISPALKDKIEKYVIENNKKEPNDDRFKSISRFYNFVMERTMECFDKGKTLDDFEALVDSEIQSFYSKLSFNALIPYYESALQSNRYNQPFFEKNTYFYLALRRFYVKQMDPYDIKSINALFNRIKNYLYSNNLTKDVSLDLFAGKARDELSGVFEYAGLYNNLTFENCKYTAAFLGLLGIKITNFLHSDQDNYIRYDLKTTELFYQKDLRKKERIRLINHNLSFFLNYLKIIGDKDYHFWMKLAEDKQVLITFKNEVARKNWLNLIEDDLEKLGDKDLHSLTLLKFFEKLHWIEIISEEDLCFQITLSNLNYPLEREFVLKTLSKKSKIVNENEIFFLKNLIS